jgi:3-methyladenine DNA glycosylase AlkD
VLDALAGGETVWERRIAIISTLAFIKCGEVEDTFRLSEKLLSDKHDLIQKAVGWALRETGKVSRARLLQFLKTRYSSLSRTSLRYSIERFSAEERKKILSGDFSFE